MSTSTSCPNVNPNILSQCHPQHPVPVSTSTSCPNVTLNILSQCQPQHPVPMLTSTPSLTPTFTSSPIEIAVSDRTSTILNYCLARKQFLDIIIQLILLKLYRHSHLYIFASATKVQGP